MFMAYFKEVLPNSHGKRRPHVSKVSISKTGFRRDLSPTQRGLPVPWKGHSKDLVGHDGRALTQRPDQDHSGIQQPACDTCRRCKRLRPHPIFFTSISVQVVDCNTSTPWSVCTQQWQLFSKSSQVENRSYQHFRKFEIYTSRKWWNMSKTWCACLCMCFGKRSKFGNKQVFHNFEILYKYLIINK